MDEYKAQLIACEAKLAKEPDNQMLLELKNDLLEAINEFSSLLEEEEDVKQSVDNSRTNAHQQQESGSSRRADDRGQKIETNDSNLVNPSDQTSSTSSHRRPLTEAELLAKKKEKNRKKKEKLREKNKQQLETAESEKQSWQSFANKKGLKGITKKSIFASPCSVTGKVGVGTNGIADAPSVGGATSSAASAGVTSKRKHY